jgi:hypothetical protein
MKLPFHIFASRVNFKKEPKKLHNEWANFDFTDILVGVHCPALRCSAISISTFSDKGK